MFYLINKFNNSDFRKTISNWFNSKEEKIMATNQREVMESQLNALYQEIEMLKKNHEFLQAQAESLVQLLDQYLITITALKELETRKTNEDILVPLGSTVYVKAKLSDVDKVLTGIGAGAYIELKPEDSRKKIEERRKNIEELLKKTNDELKKIENAITKKEAQLQERIARYQQQLQAEQARREPRRGPAVS